MKEYDQKRTPKGSNVEQLNHTPFTNESHMSTGDGRVQMAPGDANEHAQKAPLPVDSLQRAEAIIQRGDKVRQTLSGAPQSKRTKGEVFKRLH